MRRLKGKIKKAKVNEETENFSGCNLGLNFSFNFYSGGNYEKERFY